MDVFMLLLISFWVLIIGIALSVHKNPRSPEE